MTRMHRRAAAGAALFAAVVTIGGPGVATAPADPGHNSGGGGGNHGSGNGGNRGDGGNRGGDRGGDRGGSRYESGPGSRTGNGRNDQGGRWDERDDRFESRNGSGDRQGFGNSRNGGSGSDRRDVDSGWDADEVFGQSDSVLRPSGEQTTSSRIPTADTADRPTASAPDGGTVAPFGGAAGAASVPAAGGTAVPVEAPPVTFGNGRDPWALATADQVGPGGPAPAPGPPAVAATPPVVLPPAPPTAVPAVLEEQALPWLTSQMWGPVEPGPGSSALFGVAGLVLLPLAGVWLGYRQAQATRSASRLVGDKPSHG